MAKNRTGEGRVGRGLTDHLYVDVDGTLLIWPARGGGATHAETMAARKLWRDEPLTEEERRHLPVINAELVRRINAWQAARPTGTLVIWSLGGTEHAKMARDLCGFPSGTPCIAKPDLMVDDAAGETFAKKFPMVHPDAFLA